MISCLLALWRKQVEVYLTQIKLNWAKGVMQPTAEKQFDIASFYFRVMVMFLSESLGHKHIRHMQADDEVIVNTPGTKRCPLQLVGCDWIHLLLNGIAIYHR